MFLDRSLAHAHRMRLASEPGSMIVADAWLGTPPALRAAMAAAQGDLHYAAVCGCPHWAAFASGRLTDAFDAARGAPTAPGMKHLEAEALLAAGLIVTGLRALEALSARGDPAGTIALARRRHSLGDHRGAMLAAGSIPLHASAALTGARAALVLGNASTAWAFLEPFAEGLVAAPEALTAGAFAVTVAGALARTGNRTQLRGFAERVCFADHLPDTMLPAVARVAWSADSPHRHGPGCPPWTHPLQPPRAPSSLSLRDKSTSPVSSWRSAVRSPRSAWHPSRFWPVR